MSIDIHFTEQDSERIAEALGIPGEDSVIDCLAMAVGTDSRAGWITLEAIPMVREEPGVNMTLGANKVSFGQQERERINSSFLAMAIQNGVNCPIADAAKVRPVILAAMSSLRGTLKPTESAARKVDNSLIKICRGR